jgi:hypothetical protein
MASKSRHPAVPPMTLGNMRELGVSRLIASHDAFLAAGYILNEPH